MVTILVFIITLLILVVIHEFGHFFAAKRFGIKVLEFGFGIPPRVVGKKYGETLVSLNWLPFGGFVRLLGEDEVDKEILDNKRSFAAQSVGKRITVVLAGVLMNLFLAWILFWLVLALANFKVQIPVAPNTNPVFIGANANRENLIIIGSVAKDSPAERSGIKTGVRVIAVNDRFIKSKEEIVEQTRINAGQKIKITLSDLDKTHYKTVEAVPRENPPQGQGALGIGVESQDVITVEYNSLWQKIISGPVHSINLITYSYQVLASLVATSISHKDITPVSQTVAGPVGITSLLGYILAVKNPVIPYLTFLAMLSLNLAIINVLPFPGLDGGRLLFLVIEAITRKRVNTTVEKYVHTAGLVVLVALIILVTISDIRKFLL